MRYHTMAMSALVWAMTVVCAAAQAPKAPGKTALDDYIQRPDPEYKWTVAKTIDGNPATTTIIKLTSQGWRTKEDVDRPVWEHWLVIIKPKVLKTNKVFLMVTGGNNVSNMPEGASALVQQVAAATGSIVAELRMVPNQPLVFHGDGKGRNEDDLIAYGLDQFLKTGDATWVPRLPMVKSVVRAMDCIQEWAKTQGITVEGFVVAGGSKRGWTAWMTAAVDARVLAIVPMVIDVVNVEPSIRHHAEVYGFWAKAIGNYYEHKIFQRSDHPRMKELHQIEDPYYYLGRLTMPKYIVNAAGDQFFVPDSSQFYYGELKGEKLLRYVPNVDHGLKGLDVATSIVAYYQMLIAGKARPKYSWTFEKDGSILVKSETQPKQVVLWQATNPKARDFRLMTIGPAYKNTTVKPNADGSWTAKITAPKEGWTAFFVELDYDSGGLFPLKVSTAVRVLPDTLPYKNIDLKTMPYEANIATKQSAELRRPVEPLSPPGTPGGKGRGEGGRNSGRDLEFFARNLESSAGSAPSPPTPLPRITGGEGGESSAARAADHIKIYAEPGRFGGWPANHGIWSWGDEILVGFSAGHHKDLGNERHNIDREKPEEHLLARSLDGGLTWKIEDPSKNGALIPVGKSLHGITPPGLKEAPWEDCPGGIDFMQPGFALTVRMTDTNAGPARFYYSIDRGKNWQGPFRLPMFDTKGIAARTDYIVNGKHDCTLFLTAAKSDGREGRPLCVRTIDGGKTWRFVSWIGPEPKGYAIMPATVRLNESELLSAIRCREGQKSWIETYRSRDDGQSWTSDAIPVPDTGEGNPASMIRLADGKICLTYGYRAAPFGIRARLSGDAGRTWTKEIVLRDDGGGRDVGYPRSVARPDGKVVTAYYYHDTPKGDRYIAATIWDPQVN